MAARSVALAVVNYFSAALTAEAIRSARESSIPLEVIVVDNSCDDAEAARVRQLDADQVLISPVNGGYAAAINSAVRLTAAEVIIASNPDVVFHPQAIDALVARLSDRVALCGPRFVWDEAGRWMLPPADALGCISKMDEIASTRSAQWRAWWLRRRFEQRLLFWATTEPVDTPAVSGAVMCFSRSAFDLAGGFDERFALYFEEIDFMRSLTARGFRIEYVPSAVCRHLYSQSANLRADRAELYARSEGQYLDKWCPLASKLVRLAAPVDRGFRSFVTLAAGEPIQVTEPQVVEASTLPDFASAAGCFPDEGELRVDELLRTLGGERLFVRTVRRDDRAVLSRFVVAGPPALQ